jgi:hypothetical protein
VTKIEFTSADSGLPDTGDGTGWRSESCLSGKYVITGKCVMVEARHQSEDGYKNNAARDVPNHAYLVNVGPSPDRKAWQCVWGGVVTKAQVIAYCVKE